MSDDATQAMPPPGGADGELIDGRYRLLRPLGRGAVADVFEAMDERLARRVAVKLFRGDAAGELQRHESEMRMLAQLDHPALVTVYDAGDAGGRPFLVMQLVEGTTLADELARHGSIAPKQTAEWGATLASGLAYVHGQGVVHRDVKPGNVLVARDGRVHLADFGIARLVDSAHATVAGEVLGTPAYFAPEQVSGEPVGPAADVYALGLVLLECLTGHKAFEGTATEVALARLSVDPPLPEWLPPGWRSLLFAMTARLPGNRPVAAEVAERLAALAGEVTTSAPPLAAPEPTRVIPTPPPPPTQVTTRLPTVISDTATAATLPPPQRRQRVGIVVTILVLAALIVAGAVAVIVATNNRTHTSSWTPGHPVISKPRVERAVERLEQAVANS